MKFDKINAGKLIEISDDELVANSIAIIAKMLKELQIKYAILGSCGIQSYFDYFFRLPNDLDVVIYYENINKIEMFCMENKYLFNEQLGRAKIKVNKFSTHIIPSQMNLIDLTSNEIFTTVDLSGFISKSVVKKIILLRSKIIPEVKVFPQEVNLFIELVRPIYTGSLMNIFYIMRYQSIDKKILKNLYWANKDLREIILHRLNEYSSNILKLRYFNSSDINIAKSQILSIIKSLEK